MPRAFLLDADVPRARADALRQLGYDALAASGDPALGSLSDTDLLAEATHQDRVVVTFIARHLDALARVGRDLRNAVV